MKVRISSLAEREIADALTWYECQDSLMGAQFLDDLEILLAQIERFPLASMVFAGSARRAIFSRFPYVLWYTVEQDEAVVLACAHQHRNPTYWVRRI